MKIDKYITSLPADLRFARAGWVAQMLLISLVTRIAARAAGFLRDECGADLSLDDLVILLGMPVGELRAALDVLEAHSLLMRGDGVWFIPELVKAAEISEKRREAGRRGAEKTNAFSRAADLPRQNSGNVICLENSKAYQSTGQRFTKKEKRTKKEKNNKYIYISSQKVFTGDRGEDNNHPIFNGNSFTVYRREMDALQLEFPGFDYDRLWELLCGHDDFMGQNPAISNDNWYIPLVAGLRKMHARAAR